MHHLCITGGALDAVGRDLLDRERGCTLLSRGTVRHASQAGRPGVIGNTYGDAADGAVVTNHMVRPLMIAILLVTALLIGAPALATSASACGFNEEFYDDGTVHIYMECTRPKVDVTPDTDPLLPPID